jgi:hypothetical protein
LTIITGSRREAAPAAFFCFQHIPHSSAKQTAQSSSASLLHVISTCFHNIDFSLIHCNTLWIPSLDSADYTPF